MILISHHLDSYFKGINRARYLNSHRLACKSLIYHTSQLFAPADYSRLLLFLLRFFDDARGRVLIRLEKETVPYGFHGFFLVSLQLQFWWEAVVRLSASATEDPLFLKLIYCCRYRSQLFRAAHWFVCIKLSLKLSLEIISKLFRNYFVSRRSEIFSSSKFVRARWQSDPGIESLRIFRVTNDCCTEIPAVITRR